MKKRLLIAWTAAGLTGAALAVLAAGKDQEKAADAEADPREAVLEARAKLRAFYTAPPVIPHEVTDRGNEECLHCHEDTRKVGSRMTRISPHTHLQNCQQCHVGVQSLNDELEVPPVASNWKGLREPGKGTRAHAYAPPTIPHRLFMRENCLGCHYSEEPNKAKMTTHPERSQCLQCHVLDNALQF